MENIKKRYFVLLGIILFSSFIIKMISYDKFYKSDEGIKRIKNIPINIGEWKGVDYDLDQNIYDILETRSIIHRSYGNRLKNIFLSIVYYNETKVDFHAPEGCLAGKGIEISKSEHEITLNHENKKIKLNLVQLIRRNQQSDELIYYFYKSGNFLGSSYIKLRLMLALNKFSENAKSGSLIRISTNLKPGEYDDASAVLTAFIEELYPYLVKYL